jgi:hypothetical protein
VQYQTICAHRDVMVESWAFIDVTSFTPGDYIITSLKLAHLMQNTLCKIKITDILHEDNSVLSQNKYSFKKM